MANNPKKDNITDEKDDLRQKVKEAQKESDQKDETESEKQQIEDLKEALARSMADMQNMKRRAEEDKMRFVKFANAELLKTFLPIIDNFDRACQQQPEELKEHQWIRGVVSTHDEFMKALEAMGVKKMDTVGQKLDPTRHEAVMQGPGDKDMVIEEFEPGYTLHNTVVKVAKVKVGDGN